MKFEIEKPSTTHMKNTETIEADEYRVEGGLLIFKADEKFVRTIVAGHWHGVKLLSEDHGIRDKLLHNLHKRCGIVIETLDSWEHMSTTKKTKLPHTLDTEAVLMAINDTFEGGKES